MKTLKITLYRILFVITFSLLLQLSNPGGNLLAVEKVVSKTKVDETKLTPELRKQMAKMHENMAKCLRSNESFTKCRDEMRKDCEQNMKDGCPMMGPSGMGKGMGGGICGGMMRD
ncbi:MAG: hypothetical protein HQK51_09250 [Oligoflexia bacterium]|nr:hypothetical protein [Oligoflexia bacterium]